MEVFMAAVAAFGLVSGVVQIYYSRRQARSSPARGIPAETRIHAPTPHEVQKYGRRSLAASKSRVGAALAATAFGIAAALFLRLAIPWARYESRKKET
jgi:hypothetical protein